MGTQYPVIDKPGPFTRPPNLESYTEAYEGFSRTEAERYVEGPEKMAGVSNKAIGRHLSDGADRVDIHWMSRKGDTKEYPRWRSNHEHSQT